MLIKGKLFALRNAAQIFLFFFAVTSEMNLGCSMAQKFYPTSPRSPPSHSLWLSPPSFSFFPSRAGKVNTERSQVACEKQNFARAATVHRCWYA